MIFDGRRGDETFGARAGFGLRLQESERRKRDDDHHKKQLSFPKCEGFIRLNLNVFVGWFSCFHRMLSAMTTAHFLDSALMNLNLYLMPQELNKY